MVYMKNIKQLGSFVSFDAYINGDENRHFTMTVDLNDSSRSEASIDKCYHTSEALVKIFLTYAEKSSFPTELVAMSH